LVFELLQAAGKKVAVGGNIGTPCLQLIDKKEVEIFVLELSSFQLETTVSLNPITATVLNISPDHLDRYQGMEDYQSTKLSIFKKDTIAIVPAQKNWNLSSQKIVKTFSLTSHADYSVIEVDQQKWVSVAGEPWMAISDLQLFGEHNHLNVLAALGLVENAGINLFAENKEALIKVLKGFKGLPHRCEIVAKKRGVLWVNDSKATNVASAQAAIESFAENFSGRIVLIAGGDSKNADLSLLQQCLVKHVLKLITFGQDGDKLAALIDEDSVESAKDLVSAVNLANKIAPKGGVVLLAPACSSLDMFSNYEARGRCFAEAVEALAA
jgi:UDP-N-acetylmuramoylalanine--D-glutamate ligase